MQHLENISAKVNEDFSFSQADLTDLDFQPIDKHHFHVLANGKAYRAELVNHNFQRKTFTIKINGSRYEVVLADTYDQMVERLGLGAVNSNAVSDVMAPMPGLVLEMMTKAGEAVTAGQPLLILEAMKMENVIKAAADGIVEEVVVDQGAAVEKGQLLIKMAEG